MSTHELIHCILPSIKYKFITNLLPHIEHQLSAAFYNNPIHNLFAKTIQIHVTIILYQ